MWIISAQQLFFTANRELVSCLGRKNWASQLNPRHSDVYRLTGNFSRWLQPWRTQDHTLGRVRKIWAVWFILLITNPWYGQQSLYTCTRNHTTSPPRGNFSYPLSSGTWYFAELMYQRPILCTFQINVDFLVVPYKGLYGGGGGRAITLSYFPYLLPLGEGGRGESEYVKLIYVLAEHRIQNT